MKKIKLTPRLSAVASLVEHCDIAADIGTDHGFIPTYLIQNGICKHAVASDIREGPLQSAVRTAHNYNVFSELDFVCAPGLDGVKPGSVDTAIIAGMGGETIVEILKAASWVKEHKTKLVLQPQSKFELFESYLNLNGFSVSKALLIKDAGRMYIVLAVQYTGDVREKGISYFVEYLKDDPLLSEYTEGLLKKIGLRKNGLMSANVPDVEELKAIEQIETYLNNAIVEAEANGNS